eukprot:m.30194 g.30194  ORF g.30194 m.30194 type:complete len:278 (+) comp16230_c0_seq1:221-1054(+)
MLFLLSFLVLVVEYCTICDASVHQFNGGMDELHISSNAAAGTLLTMMTLLTGLIAVVGIAISIARSRNRIRVRDCPTPPLTSDGGLEESGTDCIIPENESTPTVLFWQHSSDHGFSKDPDEYDCPNLVAADVSMPKPAEAETKKRSNVTVSSKRTSRSQSAKTNPHRFPTPLLSPTPIVVRAASANSVLPSLSSSSPSSPQKTKDTHPATTTTSSSSCSNSVHGSPAKPEASQEEMYKMLQQWRPPKIKVRLSDESRRRITAISIDRRATMVQHTVL